MQPRETIEKATAQVVGKHSLFLAAGFVRRLFNPLQATVRAPRRHQKARKSRSRSGLVRMVQ
jgi:hypothetical protein